MRTPSAVVDALRGRRRNERGFVRATCPLCDEVVGKRDTTESLSYNTRTGWWSCYRCASKGRLADEARDEWPSDGKEHGQEDTVVTLPRRYAPLWCEPGSTARVAAQARQYLKDRGVSRRVIREAEIGVVLDDWYETKETKQRLTHRVVAPVRLADGKLVGWVARSYRGDIPKVVYPSGMHRHLYNQRVLLEDTEQPVFVVEGIFDAFALWPNAVACLGKPTDDQINLLVQSKRPKLVALDGDAWREALALCLKLRTRGAQADWFKLPPGCDPAEVRKQWFRKELEQDDMKQVVTSFEGDMALAGTTVRARWHVRREPTLMEASKSVVAGGVLMFEGLDYEQAKQVLESLNGKSTATPAAPPASAAAPKQTTIPGTEAPPTEVVGTRKKKGAAAAPPPPAADDDDDDDEDDEPQVPVRLKNAVNVRACVEWAMEMKKATTVDEVKAALKPYLAKVPILVQNGAKLDRMIERRMEKLAAGGAEAE